MSTRLYIRTLLKEIDTALDVAVQFDSDCPPRLREAIRYSLLAPGKRLRPILVLAAFDLCSGLLQSNTNRQEALPAACAVEMIHAYSLIHDDLPAMDNDDLRRGLPTCHRKFDEATAILAGDALLASAFEMIGMLSPPELAGRCCKELAVAAGARQLVGGQMDDMLCEKLTSNSESAIQIMQHVHHRKTGALFRAALRLGGMIAGAEKPELAALDDFGTQFGLAFQITDDLLDVLGEETAVGKRLHKDAAAAKWSYPHLLGLESARQAAEEAVHAAEQALSVFPDASVPRETFLKLVQELPRRER